MPQQSAREYLSHGQTPVLRLPVAPLAMPFPEGTAAVLLGVPYDGGTTYGPARDSRRSRSGG